MAFDFENNIDTSDVLSDILSLDDAYMRYKQALKCFNLDLIRTDNTLHIVYNIGAIHQLTPDTPICSSCSILFFTLYKACPTCIDFFTFDISGIRKSFYSTTINQIYDDYICICNSAQYFEEFYKIKRENNNYLIIKDIDIIAMLSYCKFISKIFYQWKTSTLDKSVPRLRLGIYRPAEYSAYNSILYPKLYSLTKKQLLQLICTAYAYRGQFPFIHMNSYMLQDILRDVAYRWKYTIKAYKRKNTFGISYLDSYNFIEVFSNIFNELKEEGIIPEDYSKYILPI